MSSMNEFTEGVCAFWQNGRSNPQNMAGPRDVIAKQLEVDAISDLRSRRHAHSRGRMCGNASSSIQSAMM